MDSTKPIAFTINPVRVVDAVDADSYFDPTQHPNAVQRADECREIVDSGVRALIYFSGPLDPEDERAVRTVLVQIRCAVLADRAERKLRSDTHQEAMRAYLEDEDDLAALVIRSSAPDENMRDMVARAIREERERGDARVIAEREACALIGYECAATGMRATTTRIAILAHAGACGGHLDCGSDCIRPSRHPGECSCIGDERGKPGTCPA